MTKNKGQLVIISSPSGGGKDSVIRELLKRFSSSTRLITTTSRPMRPGNVEGVDYYFIDKQSFEDKIAQEDFVEYNIYAGNYYGTQKQHLQDCLNSYSLVFSQLEVNGKHNLDKLEIPHISVFLLPESLDILRKRIENRGGLTKEKIDERMAIAKNEIANSTDYDHQIVNKEGELAKTIDKITEILGLRLLREATPYKCGNI